VLAITGICRKFLLACLLACFADLLLQMEELQQEQQDQFGDIEPEPAAAAADAADSSEAGSSQQPQQAAEAAAEGGEDEEEDSECLDGYDGGRMSSIERQLLASSLELVAAATGTLKAFGRTLLQVGCRSDRVVHCVALCVLVTHQTLWQRLCRWLETFCGGEYGRQLQLYEPMFLACSAGDGQHPALLAGSKVSFPPCKHTAGAFCLRLHLAGTDALDAACSPFHTQCQPTPRKYTFILHVYS
jgi:hypothetical protein